MYIYVYMVWHGTTFRLDPVTVLPSRHRGAGALAPGPQRQRRRSCLGRAAGAAEIGAVQRVAGAAGGAVCVCVSTIRNATRNKP